LTDGLVPAEIAAQKGLPQIDAWDYSKEPLSLRTQGQLLRAQTTSVYASIVGGGYVAWSVPGRLDHGLSIQGDVPSENHEVRLTRVRELPPRVSQLHSG